MTGPSLCARGCGFFSTPQNRNLCSKCYKDFRKEEAAKQAADLELQIQTPAAHEAQAVEEPPKTTTGLARDRCQARNKKVRLAGFECRCGHVFCGSHRYPEEHSCPSDYKKAAREALAKDNPLVKGDKLYIM